MSDLLFELPPKEDLIALITEITTNTAWDDEDHDTIDITVACNGESEDDWGYQTGDNSYSGACYRYHHWAIGYIDEETCANELATDLLDQLGELVASSLHL